MNYFNDKFFKFFDGLTKNNNKEWFEKNRPVYENEVKKPFRQLMEDLTVKLSKDLPELNRDVAKAVFRINRDIRFSKDKSPYKNHVAGVLSRKGTKDEDYPGFYVHLGADDLMVGGGKYFVSKEHLVKIRQEIYYNNKEFKKLLNDKAFKEKYKTLDGEKSKILEPAYKEFVAEQPLIANKQFWYWAKLNRKDVTGDKLDSLLMSYFKAGLKMNSFLWEAVNS
ncbi:MAG TPA: DUF2461 domain-containing protein [Chitinophagales bacterium]|nr:DUF2461 domain-containing protein [Chitinophagales bacterium]